MDDKQDLGDPLMSETEAVTAFAAFVIGGMTFAALGLTSPDGEVTPSQDPVDHASVLAVEGNIDDAMCHMEDGGVMQFVAKDENGELNVFSFVDPQNDINHDNALGL